MAKRNSTRNIAIPHRQYTFIYEKFPQKKGIIYNLKKKKISN